MNDSQRSGVKASQKLTDRKTGRVIHDPSEWIAIPVTPQVRRHLRAYGRRYCTSAGKNLPGVAGVVLQIIMLHRDFLEKATDNFARYARAEGFDDQQKLMKSLLAAR